MPDGLKTQKEISLDVDGVRVRPDFGFEKGKRVYLYEVKNGPHAGYTYNQGIVYPKMENNVPIIPKGNNAKELFGSNAIGVPTQNYHFETIHY